MQAWHNFKRKQLHRICPFTISLVVLWNSRSFAEFTLLYEKCHESSNACPFGNIYLAGFHKITRTFHGINTKVPWILKITVMPMLPRNLKTVNYNGNFPWFFRKLHSVPSQSLVRDKLWMKTPFIPHVFCMCQINFLLLHFPNRPISPR